MSNPVDFGNVARTLHSVPSDDEGTATRLSGHVKWFDPSKGYGFIIDAAGGPDILLNANVLREFGATTIAEGAEVTAEITFTPKGKQAVRLLEVRQPQAAPVSEATGPLIPARVKWFDRARGFGFANAFGATDDIFVHAETLRRSDLNELHPGEAIALRVIEGPRGRMAAEVRSWEWGERNEDDR